MKPSNPDLIADLNEIKESLNKIDGDIKSQDRSNSLSDLNMVHDIIKKYVADPGYWSQDR